MHHRRLRAYGDREIVYARQCYCISTANSELASAALFSRKFESEFPVVLRATVTRVDARPVAVKSKVTQPWSDGMNYIGLEISSDCVYAILSLAMGR